MQQPEFNKIKALYEAQVDTGDALDAWDAFDKANNQDTRRKRFLWYIKYFCLVLIGVAFVIFLREMLIKEKVDTKIQKVQDIILSGASDSTHVIARSPSDRNDYKANNSSENNEHIIKESEKSAFKLNVNSNREEVSYRSSKVIDQYKNSNLTTPSLKNKISVSKRGVGIIESNPVIEVLEEEEVLTNEKIELIPAVSNLKFKPLMKNPFDDLPIATIKEVTIFNQRKLNQAIGVFGFIGSLTHRSIIDSHVYGFGIQHQFSFGNRWFTNFDLSYQKSSLVTKITSVDLRILSIDYRSVGGKIDHINNTINQIESSVSLNYVFLQRNGINLFLGIGMSQQVGIDQNLNYLVNQDMIFSEIEQSNNQTYRYPLYSNAILGVKYCYGNRVAFNVQANISKVVQQTDLKHPSEVNVKTGLLFKF